MATREENLVRKKSVRAAHRSSTTRLLNQADAVLGAEPLNADELVLLQTNLTAKIKTLEALNVEIVELTPEDQLENEIERADEYSERVQRALMRIHKALRSHPSERATPPPDPTRRSPDPTRRSPDPTRRSPDPTRRSPDPTHRSPDPTPREPDPTDHDSVSEADPPSDRTRHELETPSTASPPTATGVGGGSKVKLPKISLPHFKGNPVYWTAFWDSYESAVHLNSALSKVDKFNYLRSLLERSAYDSIAGLTLSSANYAEAIEVLKRRFGNREVIISRHMEILLNLTAVPGEHDLRGLRRLCNEVEANVRSLKALGVEQSSYGAMLTSVLLPKLPSEIRLLVTRKAPGEHLNLTKLLTVLEEELVARERSSRGGRHIPEKTRLPSTATSLFSGTQDVARKPSACCYCQQSHTSSECQVVRDPRARQQILKTSGRCFNCLVKGHIVKKCRSAPQCQTCKRKHHPSICEQSAAAPPHDSPSSAETTATNVSIPTLNPEAPPFHSITANTAVCSTNAKSVLLQTARAAFYNPKFPGTRVELRMLLDGGSQRSYLTERARRRLDLAPVGDQKLSIAAFGSTRGGPQVCPIVNVGLLCKGYPSLTMPLFVVPMICEPLIGQPISLCFEQNPQLAGLELADWADSDDRLEVDVLVGADLYWELVTGKIMKNPGCPTAIHTRLGWVLSGPIPAGAVSSFSTNLVTTHVLRVDTQSEPTDECLKAFWELESLGIHPDEKDIYDDTISSIKLKEGRYEVSLPWKQLHPPLPDNYSLSQRRLRNLLNRLRQNPALLRDYNRIIQEQIERGIVEDASVVDANVGHLHYLPHHAIVRTDHDTTKLRVVYDASAKTDGKPSLNDCLLVGPKFNQKIFDLLVRFRSYPIGLTADIEKAFLMIGVKEGDRDALRFLWVNNIDAEEPAIRPLRFTRVVFGVCSSPFLLNSTIQHHLERYRRSHPLLVKKLVESFYVDDVVTGAASEEEALQLYSESREVLGDGGFNLRKFRTNSTFLQLKFDSANQSSGNLPASSSLSLEETYADATLGKPHSLLSSTVKVLGVVWDPGEDYLQFGVADIAEVASSVEPTKRNIVSTIGKFYDPLGFLAPVIIRFKRLFQKLCERQAQWDDVLAEALQEEWRALIADLRGCCPFSIPRSYCHGIRYNVSSYTLCGFCDASTVAYAAVVYLVMKTEEETYSQFLACKTRVAPLQSITIPRLELLSALLLARLINTVSSALESSLPALEMECYTDSTVALHWIKGTGRDWKAFVQNRVEEIRKKVPPDRWKHCSGATNPADLPSRGSTIAELRVSRTWRFGPDWLRDNTIPSELPEMPEECSTELKGRSKEVHNLVATEPKSTVGDAIDSRRFSSFRRLVKVTALVLRAVEKFKVKGAGQTKPLSSKDLSDAERLWIKEVQKSVFRETSLKLQLNLFLDEKGLWRCGGRLGNADLPYSTKYPILLPRDHPVTPLIVSDAHRRVLHNGLRDTLTEVRTRFWIVKGRSLVRRIIHRCVTCRRFEGKPFPAPPPPPLPVSRVKEDPPFTFTGVDFAGPILIRAQGKAEKTWICLFTCFTTRAVHLDIVQDMSTESFIRCLKRFAARRGLPRKFISDNGKTFKAASRFLKSVFKDDTVRDFLSEKGCDWTFNVPKAPWWGGAFERMVQSTKRCLRKMVGQASLTHDELLTAVTEIESIINSRPLSYVSAGDTEEPLTPSHLLIGRRVLNLPDNLSHMCDPGDGDYEINSTQLTRRMRHLSNILNHFWKRWRTEYLAELRESHKHLLGKSRGNPQISVGDMVIVHDDSLPRSFWKLGRVRDLIVGRDGRTRGATVTVANKERRLTTLNRPLQLLYPLEIDHPPACRRTAQETEVSEKNQMEKTPKVTRSRPQRASARRGEQIRREWISQSNSDDEDGL